MVELVVFVVELDLHLQAVCLNCILEIMIFEIVITNLRF